MPFKPNIYRIENIGKGFMAIMAKPTAGDWIEEEFANIANENINQIVSLLEPSEEFEVGLQKEKGLTEKYEMHFLSFPIQDRGLPNSVEKFGNFTKTLFQQILSGKNTLIHCRAGIGRAGMVAAAILIHYGFNVDKAFSHISLKRGVTVPDTKEQYQWILSNQNIIAPATGDRK